MNPTRSRWLIMSHAFNMDGRAASHTVTDKLKHLEAAGIEVVVLSGVSGDPDAKLEHHQLWSWSASGFRFEIRHVLQKKWGKKFMLSIDDARDNHTFIPIDFGGETTSTGRKYLAVVAAGMANGEKTASGKAV